MVPLGLVVEDKCTELFHACTLFNVVLHWFLVHHCLLSSPSRPSLEPAKFRKVCSIANVVAQIL